MTEKNYQLAAGECKNCCLLFNCSKDKDNIKKFLLSLGLVCEGGFCLEVVVIEPELDLGIKENKDEYYKKN